jgi:hypothetical protein
MGGVDNTMSVKSLSLKVSKNSALSFTKNADNFKNDYTYLKQTRDGKHRIGCFQCIGN